MDDILYLEKKYLMHDLTKDGEIIFKGSSCFWYHNYWDWAFMGKWHHFRTYVNLLELLQICWSYYSFCKSCLQLPLELFQLLQKLLQLPLESFLVFSAKFPLLENYMFNPYIILVSNRLVGWYLMKF